ncbi:MAG: amidohydrolase family protein [Pseudomonadota bacterium]
MILINRISGLLLLSVLMLTVAVGTSSAEERLPIFDAHIHYSHDAVKLVPPKQAVAALREAGLRKALVSSSDDNGTQLLLAEAPDLIVPALRPYRRRGEISTWMNDPTVIDYVEARLARHTYHAIGEFHASGDDINTEVLQHIIGLAKKHKLLLHAHSDAEAIDLIFKSYPDAMVLWAHSGFDRPEKVGEVLARHKNLWADLAFRSDQSSGGKVADDWLPVFKAFPDRFMVGTDTFAPERWYYVSDHAEFSRQWISSLPEDLRERIAYRNAEEMIARVAKARGQ